MFRLMPGLRVFSPAQLAVAGLLVVLSVIPTVIILRRMGYSGWWAIFAAISPLNVLGLWILAFAKWPLERRTSPKS
jgi:hypothetical protein